MESSSPSSCPRLILPVARINKVRCSLAGAMTYRASSWLDFGSETRGTGSGVRKRRTIGRYGMGPGNHYVAAVRLCWSTCSPPALFIYATLWRGGSQGTIESDPEPGGSRRAPAAICCSTYVPLPDLCIPRAWNLFHAGQRLRSDDLWLPEEENVTLVTGQKRVHQRP
jgi:hypothetical protein